MSEFKEGIISNDKELLEKIDKVDIHNHAITSCTKKYLVNHGIKLSDNKINNIT